MRGVYLVISGLLTLTLMGCGVAQTATEGTANVARSIFTWDVNNVHLDFTARAELNTDDDGRSSPVVIRIYQLTESSVFKAATYPDLVMQDNEALAKTLLATKEVILKPNTSVSVDVPFDKKAQVVGIAALYKDPDLQKDSWRIVLKRGDLNINKPREIIVNPKGLELIED